MKQTISFDHVAMPVGDIDLACAFYQRILGAEIVGLEKWKAGRAPVVSVIFGDQKFNLHPPGNTITLKARHPRIGGGDYCFVWPGTPESAVEHLTANGIEIEVGPVTRLGARGQGTSVYFRDPDGNLLEFISYQAGEKA